MPSLALNKTTGKAIAKLYGKDASKWAGKWIALFVSTVDYDGETRDCIRIRPRQPDPPQKANALAEVLGVEAEGSAVDVGGSVVRFVNGGPQGRPELHTELFL